MERQLDNNTIIEFRSHGAFNEPIEVHKLTRNNGDEIIGKIYLHWDDNDVETFYECFDKDGEQISPPTMAWIEVEEAFIHYARQHPYKSKLEKDVEGKKAPALYTNRKKELQHIRNDKGRNIKSSGISK
jgi:hypothetical protein